MNQGCVRSTGFAFQFNFKLNVRGKIIRKTSSSKFQPYFNLSDKHLRRGGEIGGKFPWGNAQQKGQWQKLLEYPQEHDRCPQGCDRSGTDLLLNQSICLPPRLVLTTPSQRLWIQCRASHHTAEPRIRKFSPIRLCSDNKKAGYFENQKFNFSEFEI